MPLARPWDAKDALWPTNWAGRSSSRLPGLLQPRLASACPRAAALCRALSSPACNGAGPVLVSSWDLALARLAAARGPLPLFPLLQRAVVAPRKPTTLRLLGPSYIVGLQQQRVSAGPWRGRTGLGMGEDFGRIWSRKQRYNTAPRAPPSSFGMDRRLGTDPDEAEGGHPAPQHERHRAA
ncbi:hypothetical protein ACCO45_010111 [Purpureocillium lilacinum]|uniref:Uncharacterized protein n=1 Tax=Purpureocillium lilacinum TaxID=33203 RepID=A0ACC4DGV6_PURLI